MCMNNNSTRKDLRCIFGISFAVVEHSVQCWLFIMKYSKAHNFSTALNKTVTQKWSISQVITKQLQVTMKWNMELFSKSLIEAFTYNVL